MMTVFQRIFMLVEEYDMRRRRWSTWREMIVGVAGAVALIAGGVAAAWDGVVSGTISSINVTGGANYGFRVFLGGVTNVCTGGMDWAYLNEADSNYKTYTAALLMAKAQGSTVQLYTTLVNGYCHIEFVAIY